MTDTSNLYFSSRTISNVLIGLSNEEIEGYLVGLIIGDGHIEPTTNRVVIATNNSEFATTILNLLKQLGYNPIIFYDKFATVWKVSVSSVKLHELLVTKYDVPSGNKTFTNFVPKLTQKQLEAFIAGIFDAEGWRELDKGKYLKVRVKLKNKSITTYIRQILFQKGFEPKGHEKADGSIVVEVNKRKNVRRFFETFKLLHVKWFASENVNFCWLKA